MSVVDQFTATSASEARMKVKSIVVIRAMPFSLERRRLLISLSLAAAFKHSGLIFFMTADS